MLGGILSVANSQERADKMIELHSQFDETCPLDSAGGTTWAGIDDLEEEGLFVNSNTGEEIAWKNWMTGQPNGNMDQNCGVLTK